MLLTGDRKTNKKLNKTKCDSDRCKQKNNTDKFFAQF